MSAYRSFVLQRSLANKVRDRDFDDFDNVEPLGGPSNPFVASNRRKTFGPRPRIRLRPWPRQCPRRRERTVHNQASVSESANRTAFIARNCRERACATRFRTGWRHFYARPQSKRG